MLIKKGLTKNKRVKNEGNGAMLYLKTHRLDVLRIDKRTNSEGKKIGKKRYAGRMRKKRYTRWILSKTKGLLDKQRDTHT